MESALTGCHPKRAMRRHAHGKCCFKWNPAHRCVGLELDVGKLVQSFRGADPNASLPVLSQCQHRIARQAIGLAQRENKASIFAPSQTSTGSADPNVAI